MEKIGCPPRAPPSRKPQLLFSYSVSLFRFILTIKLLIRIKINNKKPYSKNAKRKSGYIKNKNGGVLGKGERERENRFYKIGFPLAKIKKKQTLKKSARGRTDFTKIGFSLAETYLKTIFLKQCFR